MIRAKHAPFFAYPAWKQDMQKILGFAAEVRTSNFFPKSLQAVHSFRIWLFFDPETKSKMTSTISDAIQLTARGGLLLPSACDFGEWLESLGLLWKHLEFFAYPASMQGMQKKGCV